jgi:hypothetical protein
VTTVAISSDETLDLATEQLFDLLRRRRSRRFGLGMRMEGGPMPYESRRTPLPLGEQEEALLAFAACGITGPALVDMALGAGQGGQIMSGVLGRTVGSADAAHTAALVVVNDDATYLIKRPQDFAPQEFSELARLAGSGDYLEMYRRSRIKILDGRAKASLEAPSNVAANKWSLYAPGTTYFLPVADLTFLYINSLLEIFSERFGGFVIDERASYAPSGLARFARSKGGHLYDVPKDQRAFPVYRGELIVTELVAIEIGMVLQNLALATESIGLGGFPNYAEHDYGWLQALGFRMHEMPASRYLGLGRLMSTVLRLTGRDFKMPYPLGLERNGQVLLKPYCPPYYPSMEAAVKAVVEHKVGVNGSFRGGASRGAWRDPARIAEVPAPEEKAIEATIAYCEYIYRRYGRFPAYLPPFHTVLGFQACHLDVEFYDRYYRPEALGSAQREHLARWHRMAKAPGDPSA